MFAQRIAFVFLPAFLCITTFLTGCGGGGNSGGGGGTPTITSVAVGCSPASIYTNQTSTCTPTVSGTGNYSSSVTWSVNPTSIGTVSSAGVFTASSTGTATITATSTQDSTKSGTATVTVAAQSTITSVSVICTPLAILTTQTSTCTATAQGTGSYSSAVTWTATDGTITSSGVFTPTVAGTVIVTATSTEDSTKSGTASIVVGSQTTTNEWTWMGGSSTAYAPGVYGTQGVPSASNVPGSREGSVSWIDSNGNLWLFGGPTDVNSANAGNYLNDLWEFNLATNEWTWENGSNATDAEGVYGTLGIASTNNVPGARSNSVSWTDASGDFWLFGGGGFDSSRTDGLLNDLWKFNPTAKTWTWVSGSRTANAVGIYGTLGVASTNNVPGGRWGAVSWIDKSGNLWLFGGADYNDLWEFSPTTNEWTWMSGEGVNNSGVYGTLGVAAATNVPGGRYLAVSWTDSSGNLWLFGGCNENNLCFNDLWEFNLTTHEWTWMSGSSTVNAKGVYGTQGVPAASNVPGAGFGSVTWTDSSGNLWLFGGNRVDSTAFQGSLNDLWEFNPTSKMWTWVSGSNTDTIGTGPVFGVYGTLGVASASNVPGGRMSAVSWIDTSGNLWLFGGLGFDSTSTEGNLNDLWRYQP